MAAGGGAGGRRGPDLNGAVARNKSAYERAEADREAKRQAAEAAERERLELWAVGEAEQRHRKCEKEEAERFERTGAISRSF